ncbi:MAG: Fic family protein [Burkholderiales bacterium]
MPDWDDNSRQLAANLIEAQRSAAALARRTLTASDVKAWHNITMRGLDIDDAQVLGLDPADLVGEFRGPTKLAGVAVKIGGYWGVAPDAVAARCEKFFGTVNELLGVLDRRFPAGKLDEIGLDGLQAVAEASPWAHSEWVRIHPFANGNGRISRFIANAILVRYGFPPVFRLRRRPDGSYLFAASKSMTGDHRAMANYVITQLLRRGAAPTGRSR